MTSNYSETTYRETTNDPEVLREEIEQTRRNLSRDVNALGESVTPSHVARRQADKVKDRASGLKDRIMGSASDAGSATADRASGLASEVGDRSHDAASAVKQRATGNPLAAGLIALGAGWLLGSLLPASQKEQELSETVKEKAAPVVEAAQATVKDVASEAGDHLKGPASEAVAAVKEQAQTSAQNVKDEATQATSDVRDSAAESAQTVREQY
jgi:gas vesicle protein